MLHFQKNLQLVWVAQKLLRERLKKRGRRRRKRNGERKQERERKEKKTCVSSWPLVIGCLCFSGHLQRTEEGGRGTFSDL